MVLRYKRKMQLYLQKRLRIDACPAVLFQNRDNCFSLLCFLPCLHVHIITFSFSSFLPSFSPFFRLFFFFLFHLLNFMARQISKASAAPQTKYFPLLLDQFDFLFLVVFFLGGGGGAGKGGTLVDFALFLILSTTLARKDYLSSRDVIS